MVDYVGFVFLNEIDGLLPTIIKKKRTQLIPQWNLTKILYLEDEKPLEDIGQFQKLVGKLIYLIITGYDISFAVSTLRQFMHSPYMQVIWMLLIIFSDILRVHPVEVYGLR